MSAFVSRAIVTSRATTSPRWASSSSFIVVVSSSYAGRPAVVVGIFLLGAGIHAAERNRLSSSSASLWGSTWSLYSLRSLGSIDGRSSLNYAVSRIEIMRPWLVGCVLLCLAGAELLHSCRYVGFESRGRRVALLRDSYVQSDYARIAFGRRLNCSTSLARLCTNLLGAMFGGVSEYLSLVTGFGALLLVIALCYVGAIIAIRRS